MTIKLNQLKFRIRSLAAELAARLSHLQKSRFCELFLRETGDTLIDFINRLRIERARQLLREGRYSITQIAQECGFSTSQYFAKVFRQFTGISASEFRSHVNLF